MHGGQRVPAQPLRRRRLLRAGLHGRVPQLRAGRLARALHADRGRQRRSARRLHDDGADDLRRRTASATAAAAARPSRSAPSCAERELRPANVYTAPSTCNATGQCVAPGLDPLQPLHLQRHALLQRLHHQQPVRDAEHLRGNSCGLKDIGASCSAADECKSDVLRAGRLLRQRLQRRLQVVHSPAARRLHERGHRRARSGRPLRGPGSVDLRHQRQVRGGRLPEVRRRARRAGPRPARRRRPVHGRVDLRRRRHLRHARADRLLPVPLRRRAPARRPAPPTPTARSPAVCINGSCGLKPTGAACADKNECLSGFCEQGVCCATRLHRRLQVVRAAGVARHLQQRRRPAPPTCMARCADQGARQLRHRRLLRRQAAPAASTAPAPSAPAPSCPTEPVDADQRPHLRRPGRLPGGDDHRLRAVRLQRHARACNAACTQRRRLPAAQHLRSADQPLRQQEAPRPVVRRRRRLPDRQLLRRRRLLRQPARARSARPATSARSAGNCANVPARHAEPHSRCAASPPCGNTGACNGAGACQLAATTGVVRHAVVLRLDLHADLALQRHAARCAAPTPSSCSPYVCGTQRVQDQLHGRRRLRRAVHLPGHGAEELRAQAQRPGLQRRPTSASAATASTASAAAARACAHLPGLQRARRRDAARPWPPARPRRPASAPASPPCGNTGTCNGAGGCSRRATHVRALPTCPAAGRRYTAAVVLLGQRHLQPGDRHELRPYVCGSSNACRTNCTRRQRLRDTSPTARARGTAGPAPPRRRTARPAAAPTSAPAATASTASAAAAPAAAPARPATCTAAGDVHADSRAARPRRRPAARPTAPAATPARATARGGCTQAADHVAAAAAVVHRHDLQPAVVLLGQRHLHQATAELLAPYLCGAARLQDAAARRQPTASSGNYCTGAGRQLRRQEGDGAACGARQRVRQRQLRRRRLLRQRQLRRPARPATCTSAGHLHERRAPARGDRTASAPPNGTCGNTGTCNGSGACQQGRHDVLRRRLCTGATFSRPPSATGSGACTHAGAVELRRLRLRRRSTACRTDCAATADCASTGYYCTGARRRCLRKKSPGDACTRGHECTSGNCVDGVCCTSRSCGTCQACNSRRLRLRDDSATQPSRTAAARRAGACGNTGPLHERRSASRPPTAPMCGGFFCAIGDVFQPAGACNGLGQLLDPGAVGLLTVHVRRRAAAAAAAPTTAMRRRNYCNRRQLRRQAGRRRHLPRDRQCATGHLYGGRLLRRRRLPALPELRRALRRAPARLCDGHTPIRRRLPDQGAAELRHQRPLQRRGACELYDMGTQCGSSCADRDRSATCLGAYRGRLRRRSTAATRLQRRAGLSVARAAARLPLAAAPARRLSQLEERADSGL